MEDSVGRIVKIYGNHGGSRKRRISLEESGGIVASKAMKGNHRGRGGFVFQGGRSDVNTGNEYDVSDYNSLLLNKKISDINQQKQELERRNKELEQQKQGLEQQNEELEQQKQQKQGLEQQKRELERRNEELEQQNEELEQQKQQKQELEQQNKDLENGLIYERSSYEDLLFEQSERLEELLGGFREKSVECFMLQTTIEKQGADLKAKDLELKKLTCDIDKKDKCIFDLVNSESFCGSETEKEELIKQLKQQSGSVGLDLLGEMFCGMDSEEPSPDDNPPTVSSDSDSERMYGNDIDTSNVMQFDN